jgi:hypothetical protein
VTPKTARAITSKVSARIRSRMTKRSPSGQRLAKQGTKRVQMPHVVALMLKRGAKLLGREAFEKTPTDGYAGDEDAVDEGELLGGIQHRHPTVQPGRFRRDRQSSGGGGSARARARRERPREADIWRPSVLAARPAEVPTKAVRTAAGKRQTGLMCAGAPGERPRSGIST